MTDEEHLDSENDGFLRFVIVSTLKVVGIALCIMSGWVFYIGMLSLGSKGEPFNYIAVASFWSFFIVLIVLAVVIDWLKKKKES